MSTPTYNEGQEISFGNLSDLGQEQGFLHGAKVRILEAFYGKMEANAQYNIPERVGAKFKFEILKQDGTTKVLDRYQEYSTGIEWGGEKNTVTVSPDGKRLIAKKGFKGFAKSTDFYHLWETSVNAGLPEDAFKGDLSVFVGLTFLIASEKNPRQEKGKEKPFFGLLLTEENGVGTGTTPVSAPSAPVAIDPQIAQAATEALQTIVTNAGGSITRRDIPSKVQPIAVANGWDLNTRTGVMNALFELPKLNMLASQAGLKLVGETVSF